LAMRLTQEGREVLNRPCAARGGLVRMLEKMAPSELRAVERAVEILERST